jgi:hypothetical protein
MTAAALYPCLAPIRGKNKPAFTITPGPLDTPCWLWNGCLNSRGYPVRGTQEARYYVHREVFRQAGGTLQDGEQAHHRCETPRCVNPAHLVARSPLAHAREHHGHFTACERALGLLALHGPLSIAELAGALDIRPASLRMALCRAKLRGEVVTVEAGRFAVPLIEGRTLAA